MGLLDEALQTSQPNQQPPNQQPPQVQPTPAGGGSLLDQGMADAAPQQSTQPSGPGTPEEQAFLKAHPDHVYLKADPKFPNRPEGIYPTGKGNEWRKDPTVSQEPVDPELLKHSVQYGVGSAAAVGGTAVGSMALPVVLDAAVALSTKLPQVVEYMSHLDNIMKVAKTMSWAGFGLK